ncbi:MAG TPA: hypothetical protein VFV92_15520 [Candidatus Bathyarchaeia archaeon]|nr:hypothetical protein [Candidatus Bathyarchaeia archaeon]
MIQLVMGVKQDPWLGALHSFPTVLHGRASVLFDVSRESLQKALVEALGSMLESSVSRDISVADRVGYQPGRVRFRVGVGNGDGFDIFDTRERERILTRVENVGAFDLLDLLFHLHYSVDDGRPHKVRGDQYLVRLVFQRERVELLLHHLKGVRRVEPGELVRMIVDALNVELRRLRYSEAELEQVSTT